jgi:adenosylcobinamide kinase / adenosylcobinamide-phosphate guanylyltransferase
MAVTLVTGPVRSGKSARAMSIARSSGLQVSYVATAMHDAGDREWESRLERHARERPSAWETIESAGLTQDALLELFREAESERCLLVDSLGTWIGARMAGDLASFERDAAAFAERLDRDAADIAAAMLESRARVIVVAEEVGWDVVPTSSSARVFRDILGRMKQRLAAGAEQVLLVVCGFAIDLRALGSASQA